MNCACSEPVTLAVTRSEERVVLNTKKTPCEKDGENYEESAEFKKWLYEDYVKMNEEEDYVKNEDDKRNRNERKEQMKITVSLKVKPCRLADRCLR